MEKKEGLAFSWLVTFWALNYTLVKIALAFVNPFLLAFLRLLMTVAFLLIVTPRSFVPLKGLKANLYLFIFSFLGIYSSWTLWYVGESYISPSLSVILMYTYPVIAVILSAIILKERVTRNKIIGTLIGFSGIFMIFFSESSFNNIFAMLLVIGSAFSWALSIIVYKKYLSAYDYKLVNAYQMLYSLPLSLALFPFFRISSALNAFFWGVMLIIAIPGTAFTFLAYVYLYSKHEVSKITPYLFLVPAISVVFSYLIFGETLLYTELFGYILLAAGIYISSK
ncbi:MAG: DMT family transporter [Nitrososphaeria archaeon]